MIPVVEILCAVVLIAFVYKWRMYYKLKEKLAWLPSIPGWPILGNALEFGDTTEILNDIARLISNCGKIIQVDMLTQLIIIATDYDFMEYTLGTQMIINKAQDYEYMMGWLGTGLLTSDAPKWKKRRKMITPAFHFSILEQFFAYFESNSKTLIEQLKKELNKDSFDICPYIYRYTLDTICETAMGVSLHTQTNKDSKYVANVKEICSIITNRSFSALKRKNFFYKFSRDYFRELIILRKIHSVVYSVIDAKIKERNAQNNHVVVQNEEDLGVKRKYAFLDILLMSTVDGEPLSREDIREEVDTFMFEGHDTTASALSFSIFLISKSPDVQSRILEEQKKIFHEDLHRSATYNDFQNMKYLELVIKESLRLYPPVPMIGRRPNKDTEYKGNIIPEGTNIMLYIYGILRDPEHFSNPEKFDPNRTEFSDVSKPYSFVPFSAGPRNCIGQKFAMLEMKSTLSNILRTFEVLPATPEHEPIIAAEVVLKSKNGLRIKLVKREL